MCSGSGPLQSSSWMYPAASICFWGFHGQETDFFCVFYRCSSIIAAIFNAGFHDSVLTFIFNGDFNLMCTSGMLGRDGTGCKDYDVLLAYFVDL